jgi:hypothetical protein
MARLFPNFATAERISRGKSAIPGILELDGLDVGRHRDDFQGDLFKGGAAPGIYQSTASGTASAAAAVTTGANGCILLDSGTDNAGRSDLSLGVYYTGSRNAHVWFYAKVSSVATEKFELGFTDVVSGTDAGAVNGKAANTFNADNAVVLCFDTADNTVLELMGVKATTAATQVAFSTTLVGDTFYYFGIELRDTWARGYLLDANGKLIEQTGWMVDAVTSTTLLTPWAFQQNRAGSAHTMTIDLLDVYQRRSATA